MFKYGDILNKLTTLYCGLNAEHFDVINDFLCHQTSEL